MGTAFTERPEFVRGRATEQRVAAWLQGRGWFVIPSYDYSGEEGQKAPRLQGLSAGHAVPDLDVARDGGRRWIEVKCKEHANLWRSLKPWGGPTLEHGIDWDNYLDYLEVKRITGDQVWIAIYEEDTGQLLTAEIGILGQPRQGSWLGKRIANWPRSRFLPMAEWERDTR